MTLYKDGMDYYPAKNKDIEKVSLPVYNIYDLRPVEFNSYHI